MNDNEYIERILATPNEKRYLRAGTIAVKAIDVDKRTVPGIASTPNADRYREMLPTKAFGAWLDVYRGNPIFAANHRMVNDRGEPLVIGTVDPVKIQAKGLSFVAHIDDDDISEKWFQKMRKRIIRGISVGFIPHKWERKEVEREDGTMGSQLIYTEVELLEISVAPIPANRESLIAASADVQRIVDDPKLMKDLTDHIGKGLEDRLWERISPKVGKLIDIKVAELSDADGDTDDFNDTDCDHDAPRARVIDPTSILAGLKQLAAT